MENQSDQQPLDYSLYALPSSIPPGSPDAAQSSYPSITQTQYARSLYPEPTQYPYPEPMQAYPTYPEPAQSYPMYSELTQPYPEPVQSYPHASGADLPPRDSFKVRSLWPVIIAVVIMLVIGGVLAVVVELRSGPGGNLATVAATSIPTQRVPTQIIQSTPVPTTQASPGIHTLGDAASLDGWQLAVNSAQTSPGTQDDTLQNAGDVFLEVDVSVTNQTSQTQEFSSLLDLALKDSNAQTYSETSMNDVPGSLEGNVDPGDTMSGTVVYEVPETMHSFEFDFTPDALNSTDVAVWNFTV